MIVLVTGATGYIGGRLVPRLLDRGVAVRVLVRDRRRIAGRSWADRVEVVQGDLLQPETLRGAFGGVDTAYYLVHSLTSGRDYDDRDISAAKNFADAADQAGGLRHVVYLGGILPEGDSVSMHLRSRARTGRTLADRLPVTELRAGPIIGSGSASFEMVRYLTERLPAMVAPRWIRNPVQPIAIRDILAYLLGSLGREPMGVVEVGADRLTFKQMMQVYAQQRGLMRRLIVPVPVLAPRLAARWVGLVTPISNRLAVPLVEGVVQPVVADTTRARELFPGIEPIPYREAVARALDRYEKNVVETRWSGALGHRGGFELADQEGLIREVRSIDVAASAREVFTVCVRIGGDRGYPAWGWAWAARGLLDKLVGGPGLRRGRRHPTELLPGEALDFWRVEHIDPPQVLRLRAEMKVPGRAWLQFETGAADAGHTRLTQTALFEPKGLLGVLYWYLLYPVHWLIFMSTVRELARQARAEAAAGSGAASVAGSAAR